MAEATARLHPNLAGHDRCLRLRSAQAARDDQSKTYGETFEPLSAQSGTSRRE